jgi:hypothetical protein
LQRRLQSSAQSINAESSSSSQDGQRLVAALDNQPARIALSKAITSVNIPVLREAIIQSFNWIYLVVVEYSCKNAPLFLVGGVALTGGFH